jgi:hypothetical protein
MTHNHHLVNLLYFLQEERCALQVHLKAVLFHGLIQDFIVRFREFDTWEQITGDT